MSFVTYDIIFLILFAIFVIIFFYRNKKNVKREMKIAFLYRSQLGVKVINYIGTNYRKTLKALKYPIIVVGYILMAGVTFLLLRATWIYVRYPTQITSIVKAPPIAPVIPYFPKIFGLESFFPPLYFTYFIIAVGLVAIVHEFSHGIYMKYNKVRIKSTGVLFLGPLLGAFVEQDDRDMKKIAKSDQLAILGAGVFANIVLALLFLLIWWMLFYVSFVPNGAIFNDYIISGVPVNAINHVGGLAIGNPTNIAITNLIEKNNLSSDITLETNKGNVTFTKVVTSDGEYYITPDSLKSQLSVNTTQVYLYDVYPAIKSGLRGSIIKIDNTEIKDHNDLVNYLSIKKPGDKIIIDTRSNDQILQFNLVLDKNPSDESRPLLGISNSRVPGLNTADFLAFFKDPYTDYKTSNEFFAFIYFLCFWIFFLNLAVAFFNMVPASIFDGGRFFYLTVWIITGKEKKAKKAYKWSGYIALAILVIIMASWLFGILS